MPAKFACDSVLGPRDVLIVLSHWCSFILYETDDQENVETWSAGFRHRNCDKGNSFGNQIAVERGMLGMPRSPLLSSAFIKARTLEYLLGSRSLEDTSHYG
jgi:hypothetical protein